MDAGLLGLGSRRLLLGAWHLGDGALHWRALDPGYWGWGSGAYLWHAGYWGPQVGFYGGIDYGFGYVGVGYAGGYWNNGAFFYNSAVNNINRTVVRNATARRSLIMAGIASATTADEAG